MTNIVKFKLGEVLVNVITSGQVKFSQSLIGNVYLIIFKGI